MSPLLSEIQHCLYQKLVSIEEWAVQIRRFDIRYVLNSLIMFSVAPREGHLTLLVNIFGYLQIVPGKSKGIIVSPEYIEDISGKGDNVKDRLETYPGSTEEIDDGLP